MLQCTCNPIWRTLLLHNIANGFYQRWLSSFSFSNHPVQRHLALFTQRITGQPAKNDLASARAPSRGSATSAANDGSATGEEIATLLSLIHMLRSKSAQLMELIRVAEDIEDDTNGGQRGRALPIISGPPIPTGPSFARITAPCALPDFNVLRPHAAAPRHTRRRSPARSRSRSRSGASEESVSQPDRFAPPPTLSDEDGSEESRAPRYAWPFWYHWTVDGVLRGRCRP